MEFCQNALYVYESSIPLFCPKRVQIAFVNDDTVRWSELETNLSQCRVVVFSEEEREFRRKLN